MSSQPDIAPFTRKMRADGLPEIVVRTFAHYYDQLVAGETGLISEADIEAVDALPDADALEPSIAEVGRAALGETAVIKLNGGLGTSMGLDRAKSLLEVKNGLSFLDVVAQQALVSGTPLVLMNSFSTRDDSLAALDRYPELAGSIPLDFMQHRVPKVLQEDLSPAQWPAAPELEWCPPGHGDIYTALVTTGMLDAMLEVGFVRAFVSNVDNLGAALDTRVLGYFVDAGLPFMMEVADRTAADKKGGHLARLRGGQLILRESAQCPDRDVAAFQDVSLYKYFNTNNLWIDLRALRALMDARSGILGLSMIRNRKTLDPRDPASPPVYQLETAMGSAIAVFEGAGAIRVPRSRFAPVKTTSDLLSVRSDDYSLDEAFRIVPNPARDGAAAIIDLDPAYYRLIDQLEARFPHGPPSLIGCDELHVVGDVTFGREVALTGVVRIENPGSEPLEVPDGATLIGNWPA